MRAGRILTLGAVGAILFSSVSCVGSSADDPAGNQQANGGIGGSGSGTLSGYGSVIVNDTREFDVEAQTLLSIDGTSLNANDGGRSLPLGATVEFILGPDVGENLATGTATEIRAFHQVVGPITGKAPLRVLGQAIADTDVTDDATGARLALAELVQGQVVQVAGHLDQSGVLQPSRFALPAVAPLDWRVRGHIKNLDHRGASFMIGAQLIRRGHAELVGCPPSGLADDQKVLVVASAGDDPADGLDGVHRIECLREGLGILDSLDVVPPDLPVAYTGIISASTVDQLDPAPGLAAGETVTLVVDGQVVEVSDSTVLLDGTAGPVVEGTLTSLKPGALVDVDGRLDSDGVVHADRVVLLPGLLQLLTNPIDRLLEGLVDGLLGLITLSPPRPEVWIRSPIDGFEGEGARPRAHHEISLLALSTHGNGQVEVHEVGGSGFARDVLAALPDRSGPEAEGFHAAFLGVNRLAVLD